MLSIHLHRRNRSLSLRNGALAIAGTALTLAAAPLAKADPVNLVQNGNFANTSAYYNYNGTTVGTNVNNSNLAGWQINGCGSDCGFQFIVNSNLASAGFYDGIDGHESTFYSTPGATPDGSNAFMSDGSYATKALYQAVSGLDVGQTYTLSFYQASMQQTGYSGASTDKWMVGLGNGTNFTTQYGAAMNNPSQGSTGWVQQSLTFVANATSETLFFFATASANANPPFLLLDDVSLTGASTAVPEPASIALLGLGALGMVAVRRHRRKD